MILNIAWDFIMICLSWLFATDIMLYVIGVCFFISCIDILRKLINL